MDFLPRLVGADGVIRGPAGAGRAAVVLRDDLADVAVEVLVGEEGEGQAYDVTGGEAITLGEAAEQMARITGKPIRFHDETLDEAYESRRGFGAPRWEVTAWISSYVAIASGEFAGVTDAVARMAGHEPVRLAEFVEAHPESLAHVTEPQG